MSGYGYGSATNSATQRMRIIDHHQTIAEEEQYDEDIVYDEAESGEDGDDVTDSIDDNTSISQSNQKQKHKRRSKNDNKGRDFQCGCGKRYLSYPALYTHIKTKHNGETQKGTNTSQFQTGRGRGRPRKIVVEAERKDREHRLIDSNAMP